MADIRSAADELLYFSEHSATGSVRGQPAQITPSRLLSAACFIDGEVQPSPQGVGLEEETVEQDGCTATPFTDAETRRQGRYSAASFGDKFFRRYRKIEEGPGSGDPFIDGGSDGEKGCHPPHRPLSQAETGSLFHLT